MRGRWSIGPPDHQLREIERLDPIGLGQQLAVDPEPQLVLRVRIERIERTPEQDIVATPKLVACSHQNAISIAGKPSPT